MSDEMTKEPTTKERKFSLPHFIQQPSGKTIAATAVLGLLLGVGFFHRSQSEPDLDADRSSQNAAVSYDCETDEIKTNNDLKENSDGDLLVTSITEKDDKDVYLWGSDGGTLDKYVSLEEGYNGSVLKKDDSRLFVELTLPEEMDSKEGKKVHFIGLNKGKNQIKEEAIQTGHLYCWEIINRIAYEDADGKRPVAHYYCASKVPNMRGFGSKKTELGYSYVGLDGEERMNVYPGANDNLSIEETTFPAESIQVDGVPTSVEVYTNNDTGKKFDQPKAIQNDFGYLQLPQVVFTPQNEVKTQAQRDQLSAIAEKYGDEICRASFGFAPSQEQQNDRQP